MTNPTTPEDFFKNLDIESITAGMKESGPEMEKFVGTLATQLAGVFGKIAKAFAEEESSPELDALEAKVDALENRLALIDATLGVEDLPEVAEPVIEERFMIIRIASDTGIMRGLWADVHGDVKSLLARNYSDAGYDVAIVKKSDHEAVVELLHRLQAG